MIRHLILFVIFFSSFAEASLMIHPIRVQFEQADRFQEVTLINQSQTTNSYRLEFMNTPSSTAVGPDNIKFVNSMLRVSPRQVTLRPGERQTVKLSIRRPAKLQNAEYRAQLRFQALPPPAPLKAEDSAATGVTLQFRASFVIPVVIVQGKPNINISLEKAAILYNQATPADSKVLVTLANKGTYSGHGDIRAYWKPNGGKESELGLSAGFNSWPGLGNVEVQLGWLGTNFAMSDGVLRVVYDGARGYQGIKFAERQFSIQRGQISMMR